MKSLRIVAPLVAALLGACSQGHEHAGHSTMPMPAGSDEHAAHATGAPSGYAPVMLTSDQAKALGLTTTKVETRAFTKSLRTVGVVTLDETRTAHVHSKVRGFIEQVTADFVGKPIKAGAPLLAIYSQPVYAAELEYVALLKQKPTSIDGPEASAWRTLLDASRRRLLLWDVPKAQIDRLEATLEPQRTFTLYAPRSGIVVSKQAFVGNYADPETELYLISDLSKLWVVIDVYDDDLPNVHVGAPVTLAIEGIPDPIEAKVSFLLPTIDEATRTLKARIDLDNKDGRLRAGAFATASLSLDLGEGLAVPEDAVLHTGKRDIVFVVHGGQHVMPMEVQLGENVGGFYRVLSGLSEGDEVATGAQFLLDSESRLEATSGAGGGHAGHSGH